MKGFLKRYLWNWTHGQAKPTSQVPSQSGSRGPKRKKIHHGGNKIKDGKCRFQNPEREESNMECMRISSYSISAQELHYFTYHNNMYGTFLNSQLPSYPAT